MSPLKILYIFYYYIYKFGVVWRQHATKNWEEKNICYILKSGCLVAICDSSARSEYDLTPSSHDEPVGQFKTESSKTTNNDVYVILMTVVPVDNLDEVY